MPPRRRAGAACRRGACLPARPEDGGSQDRAHNAHALDRRARECVPQDLRAVLRHHHYGCEVRAVLRVGCRRRCPARRQRVDREVDVLIEDDLAHAGGQIANRWTVNLRGRRSRPDRPRRPPGLRRPWSHARTSRTRSRPSGDDGGGQTRLVEYVDGPVLLADAARWFVPDRARIHTVGGPVARPRATRSRGTGFLSATGVLDRRVMPARRAMRRAVAGTETYSATLIPATPPAST